MPFSELAHIVCPILEKKARMVGLDSELDSIRGLLKQRGSTSECPQAVADNAAASPERNPGNRRRIRCILEAMGLATLLKLVQKLIASAGREDSVAATGASGAHGPAWKELDRLIAMIEDFHANITAMASRAGNKKHIPRSTASEQVSSSGASRRAAEALVIKHR